MHVSLISSSLTAHCWGINYRTTLWFIELHFLPAAFQDSLLWIVRLETTAKFDFQEKKIINQLIHIQWHIQRFSMCTLLTVSSVNCFSNLQDVKSNEDASWCEIANHLTHPTPINLPDVNDEPASLRKAAIFAFTMKQSWGDGWICVPAAHPPYCSHEWPWALLLY